MEARLHSARLRRLPRATVLGREVAVAIGLRARLLGLAHLDRQQAGAGLLIPGCSSVHTFGMRFPLDLVFIDGDARTRLITVYRDVPPRRIVSCRTATAVLELPTEGK
jgi:uncharacterized membrane protein (UPF0127 family)